MIQNDATLPPGLPVPDGGGRRLPGEAARTDRRLTPIVDDGVVTRTFYPVFPPTGPRCS